MTTRRFTQGTFGEDAERGTGRTRAQIIKLKPGALFVWCNESLSYPFALAFALDRGDITLAPRSVLTLEGFHRRCQGYRYSEVVLDHYIALDPDEQEVFKRLSACVR